MDWIGFYIIGILFSVVHGQQFPKMKLNLRSRLDEIEGKIKMLVSSIEGNSDDLVDKYCPCVLNGGNDSIREDLMAVKTHIISCDRELGDLPSKYDGKEDKGQTVRDAFQQIRFLKDRVKIIKTFLGEKDRLKQKLTTEYLKTSSKTIIKLINFYNASEVIPYSDPRKARRRNYSPLIEQRRRRKPIFTRLSKTDVCIPFQKLYCVVDDILSWNNDTYLAAIKDANVVLYQFVNGTSIEMYRPSFKIGGLAKIKQQLIIGNPTNKTAHIFKVERSSLKPNGIMEFDAMCPFSLIAFDDKIAVSCHNGIRIYDESWNLLSKFNDIFPYKLDVTHSSWITFNPVSRLLIYSDSYSSSLRAFTLEGRVVFEKYSSWFPLRNPAGVAVSRNGDFYVADQYEKRVVKYTASGSFVGHIQGTNSRSLDVTTRNTLLCGDHLSSVSEFDIRTQ